MLKDFLRVLAAFAIVGSLLTVAIATSVRADPIIAVGVDGKEVKIERKTITLWELSVYVITNIDKGEYKKFQMLGPNKIGCEQAKVIWAMQAARDPSARSVVITCRPIKFPIAPRA